MTLKELLESQGLSEEQINKIVATMKENKIFTSSEENLDIRYGKLKTDFEALTSQHGEAKKLIEELKKTNKGNEDLQTNIKNYEAQIAELQNKLVETQKESAIKLALLEAKAVDVDYMTFKLKEKGEIELDENGKIKNLEDKITGLKVQFPKQFETTNEKQIDEQRLPGGNSDHKPEPATLADAIRAQYETK